MSHVYSRRPGMGAIPFADGVTYRVWAPHAQAVSVAGSFNHWNPDTTHLFSEGNGLWSADIGASKAGDEYKFVLQNGDKTLWRIDPYARNVKSSVGNAIVYENGFDWTDQNYRTPAWHEMVIYEMHIGTFNDQPGGPPGNIDQVIAQLSYLQSLGINMIQLMPAMEFAGGYSWGYNPAHIFALETDYVDGPDAMKRFINAAHNHGIGVIFDVVYNHFGPSDLDLWQFDGWSQHNLGGIYFYNDWRAETPWGATRPDYGREEVRRYIRDNALMWLEEYHADGLRWDATAYIRNAYGNNSEPGVINDGWDLMRQINDEIDKRQPWKISIAEDMRNNAWVTKESNSGGAGFDSQWNALFVHTVREAVISPFDHDRNMYYIAYAIAQRYFGDALKRIIYTESHDEVANGKARLTEEVWPGKASSWHSKKRSMLAAALVFTSPGIPMIFQGQEFLESGWFDDTQPLDHAKQTVFSGILRYYRDLIAMRRNLKAYSRGLSGQQINVSHINNTDKIIAFHRWHHGGSGDDVVIICNFSSQNVSNYRLGIPKKGRWRLRLNSDSRFYDNEFNEFPAYDIQAQSGNYDGLNAYADISIGSYSCLIYSQ